MYAGCRLGLRVTEWARQEPLPISEVRKIDIYDRNLSSLTAISRVYYDPLDLWIYSGGTIQYGVKYEELDSSFIASENWLNASRSRSSVFWIGQLAVINNCQSRWVKIPVTSTSQSHPNQTVAAAVGFGTKVADNWSWQKGKNRPPRFRRKSLYSKRLWQQNTLLFFDKIPE